MNEWIRLIVGFQPPMVISPTASWIRWCVQYSCELMWTCLIWAERSTPDNFWVPSHRFNSAMCRWADRNHSDHLYWLRASSRLPNSLMPSTKLRSAKPPAFYVFGVTRSGIEPRPAAPREDTLSTRLRGGGNLVGGQYDFRHFVHKYFHQVTIKAKIDSWDSGKSHLPMDLYCSFNCCWLYLC